MPTTYAPNTDPLPSSPSTSCIRSARKPARWTPYGSRSAPPTIRRDSYSKATPEYTLPLSPRLTPESNPSTGQKSHAPTIEEIPEDTQSEKHVEQSHEKNIENKGSKKYECTDDFIDVILGILSLIYCSPLLISGGRTFVIPQNFSTQPPPLVQSAPVHTSTALTHHASTKPNHMRWFVERLLERTRPPRAVCQLAVAYLVSLTDAVQGELRTAAEGRLRQQYPPLLLTSGHGGGGGGMPMPVPYSRAETPDNQLPPPYSALPAPTPAYTTIGMPPIQVPTAHTHTHSSALLDPRRVLLAAMVLAHKFHLDKTWTNKAWGKISGLTPIEVGRCERTVAIALGHRLWAGRA